MFFDRIKAQPVTPAEVAQKLPYPQVLELIRDGAKEGEFYLDFDSTTNAISKLSGVPSSVKTLVDMLYKGYSIEPQERALVDYAYATALAMHGLQRRRTGQRYIVHPHNLARRLVEWGKTALQ